MRIIVLGTGSAGVTKCYNTCFAIENNGEFFLVDGGGGNGILAQLEKAEVELRNISNIFISHTHTDHILGIAWVIRFIISDMLLGKIPTRKINVYGNDIVIDTIKQLCELLINTNIKPGLRYVNFVTVKDRDTKQIAGMNVRFFDALAKSEKQYGFDINDNFIVFTGDKPLHKDNFIKFNECGWLLHEAYCLHHEKDEFLAYEKNHCTVYDAAKIAQEIAAKNLVLWHAMDNSLDTRKKNYTEEVQKEFSGNVFIPNDLDIIELL